MDGFMLVVLVLCVFIILLPLNLHNTISSTYFVRYMGIGQTDLMIGIQQTDNIEGKVQEVSDTLAADAEVSTYTALTTKTFTAPRPDGTVENIKVELGDHSVFPLAYASGFAPTADDEIALSAMNADELGLQVGDSLTLLTSQGEKSMTVCGIYSDITNGGKTAKATFTDDAAPTMWSSIYVLLTDTAQTEAKVSEYAAQFSFAKVTDIAEYMNQTFGTTVQSVGMAALAAAILAPVIAFLITLLFMRMLVARERYPIAVMKAIGFTGKDMRRQYLTRGALVLVLGLLLGALLVATLGEALIGAILSSLGVITFELSAGAWPIWVFSSLIIGVVVLLASMLATARIDSIKVSENIKEA